MDKIQLDEILKSKRIQIKKHSLDDAKIIFLAIENERERLSKFLPWPSFIKTESDEYSYILSTHESRKNFKSFDYSIICEETKKFIGTIGVLNIDWANGNCEIGYWLLSEYEGKGFMNEALSCLIAHLFNMGFYRIEIRCTENNIRSIRVPIRLNFAKDGILRHNIIESGERKNTIVFSKLSIDQN